MTESTGGSDVGLTETVARQDEAGVWRLYGRKWFTSATTAEMALTLARPEGNQAGGRGLALFFVETRAQHGRLQQIEVNRLKDKLGTRKVPTAELNLIGTPAIPVAGLATGRQALDVLSEVIEAFGGAGYIEDTGLPSLMRDAHVLLIWEGTTNVLALDMLRALNNGTGLAAMQLYMDQALQAIMLAVLDRACMIAQTTWQTAIIWLELRQAEPSLLQAGMRRFALTIARTIMLVLMLEHAQWSAITEHDY